MVIERFQALRAVAEYLAAQTLTVDVETVTLTQTFPRYACQLFGLVTWLICDRKTFDRADFSKSLKELGLTPSAVRAAPCPVWFVTLMFVQVLLAS